MISGFEQMMNEKEEKARQQEIEQGTELGTELKLIRLVLKKLKKFCTVAQIADALEETEERIGRIMEIAKKHAPEYDERQILEEIMKENS